jgi:site-specific DNA-cytosine methylase
MRWFVKSRRAQNVNDYETWVEGGVSPTLNAFDNGNDTRATVLIFTAQRVGEPPRIYQDITPSLLSRMGTGGNNTPMIVDYKPEDAIVRRLTPTECERLMGWPDNHTLHRADGKTSSDSTRYKMCGNGVASPVAKWIGEHLLPLLGNE